MVQYFNNFRHYIIGYQKFVYTNQASIKYLVKKPNVNDRIIRWLLLLQKFYLTVVEKPGK